MPEALLEELPRCARGQRGRNVWSVREGRKPGPWEGNSYLSGAGLYDPQGTHCLSTAGPEIAPIPLGNALWLPSEAASVPCDSFRLSDSFRSLRQLPSPLTASVPSRSPSGWQKAVVGRTKLGS